MHEEFIRSSREKKLGEVEAKVKAEELAIERERALAKDAKRRNDEMKITLKVAEKTIEEITGNLLKAFAFPVGTERLVSKYAYDRIKENYDYCFTAFL